MHIFGPRQAAGPVSEKTGEKEMKRIAIAAALLIALSATAGATPYNTITVDGVWGAAEWDQANETKASNTFAGWADFGNVRDILVTWDASNLYVAVKGNSWNNAMLIYIDSSSITTGQENADYFQGYDTQSSFDPDFVCGHYNMQWGSGGFALDVRSISAVDGSTLSLLPTAAIAVKDKNSDGGLAQGFTEISIPWSLIGLQQNGYVRVACGVGWAINQNPVIPAGGLGGFSGDELGGTDQQGGTDATDSTLDTPAMVVYDGDGNGLPDQLTDETPPSLIEARTLQGDNHVVIATFDEPVSEASAENVGNWTITGGLGIMTATVQANPAVVHLQLAAPCGYGESYTVEANNIADIAGNVSGLKTTNFCIAQITFMVHMNFKILSAGEVLDVGLEGGRLPLTWDPTCDMQVYDDGTNGDAVPADSIFTNRIDFCLPYAAGADPPVVDLFYKYTWGCAEWESIDNHSIPGGLNCGTGQFVAEVWWNDANPDNYTTAPVDVVFSVDLSDSLGARLLAGINGGTSSGGAAPPLNWNVPSENALTDAGYPGGVASDGVYGTVLRFPANTLKNIDYKYLYNDEFECGDQGNRQVFLNTAAFDTLGGANGPLVLPTARWNRCTLTSRAVEVTLSVDMSYWPDTPDGGDIIAVNGTPNNQSPPVINWDFPSINPMTDSGGGIYTVSLTFPDSSEKFVEYKYAMNEVYECAVGQGNRFFWIDSDEYGTAAGPQILALDVFNVCEAVGVDEGMADAAVLRLDANYPNPFNPKTSIRFTLNEAARVDLRIYDMSGRLVRVLLRADAPAGDHTVAWNGRDDAGRPVTSGIYFARIGAASEVRTQKMTLLK